MMNNNFIEINTGFNLFDDVPFEIAIIFERGGIIPGEVDNSTHLFTKVGFGNNQSFFAESYGYYLFREYLEQGGLFTEKLQPITINNIQPYYEAYANGFYKGYSEYNAQVEHSTALFNKDTQIIANRVFKTVTTSIPNMTSTGGKRKGDRIVKTLKKSLWEEAGRKTGEKYKAWYFIINNPKLFTGLFRQDKQMIARYKLLLKMYKNQDIYAGLYFKLNKLIGEIEGNKDIQGIKEPETGKENNYTAKYYALAYFFDCEATNNRKYENQTQAKTESDLYQYSEKDPKPNTIRKEVDNIKVKGDKIFNIDTLINLYGNDWREKVIELSKYPEKVKTFLQNKRL